MKLYFYIIDEYYSGKDDKLRFEECEVVEKPKTYTPVGKFPRGYYGRYVKKEGIGNVIGYSKDVVVLLERDDKKAQIIFKDFIEREISQENHRHDGVIERLLNRFKAIREVVDIKEEE